MIISVKEIRNFLINIFIPLIIGYLSSILTMIISGTDISTYYLQLTKPSFAPPAFIFPIVWTILYILMGISSYLILRKGYNLPKVRDAIFYYGLQLVLNFIWSILFFGFGLRFTALIDIIIMILVSIIMISKFSKIDKRSGYINLIYLMWLVYAGFLNY
ncbi:TPA: TspO/MBR family protein, partial [Clostridioides difficile]